MEISLQDSLDAIDTLWEEGKRDEARYSALRLPIREFLNGVAFTAESCIIAPLSIIKIPFSLKALAIPDEMSLWVHENAPGVTDLTSTAFKAAACFFNIGWAPILGFLNPKELYHWHLECGLIEERELSDELFIETTPFEKPTQILPTLDYIDGMEALKKEVDEKIIAFLQHPEKYLDHGISAPTGILFDGPEGRGKEFTAKAIAGTLGWSFEKLKVEANRPFWIPTSDNTIHDAFERASEKAPCILFLDDLDLIASKNAQSELIQNTSLTQLMNELQFSESNGIFVIAATNDSQQLVPIVQESKKLSSSITMYPPDEESRCAQIEQYLQDPRRQALISPSFDYDELTQITDGLSTKQLHELMEKVVRDNLSKHLQTHPETPMKPLSTVPFYQAVEDLFPKEGLVESLPKLHTLDDVAGMEDLKKRIREEILHPLRHKEQYEAYGLSPPDGVLFFGPPGCGKTFIAKAIAGELGWTFMEVNMGQIGEPWIHATTANIRKIFEQAAEKTPCILFFDEFDSIAGNRNTSGIGGGSEARIEEVNQLLQELDSSSSKGIFVIAATNRYETIDPAVKRSKRISTHIEIPAPDIISRKAQIEHYLQKPERKELIDPSFDYQKLAEITEGSSAADLVALMEKVFQSAVFEHLKLNPDEPLPPLTTDLFFKAFVEQLLERLPRVEEEDQSLLHTF
jgi:transitional endoplasmic reticulum ATPase